MKAMAQLVFVLVGILPAVALGDPSNRRRVSSVSAPETAPSAPVVTKAQAFYLSGGVDVGPGYLFPAVNFQFAVGRQITLGISPLFAEHSETGFKASVQGAFLTSTYYFTREAPRGFWIQAGIGGYAIRSTLLQVEEERKALAFLSAIGWRGLARPGFYLGLGVGLQYVSTPASNASSVEFGGCLPIALLDIGFRF